MGECFRKNFLHKVSSQKEFTNKQQSYRQIMVRGVFWVDRKKYGMYEKQKVAGQI